MMPRLIFSEPVNPNKKPATILNLEANQEPKEEEDRREDEFDDGADGLLEEGWGWDR